MRIAEPIAERENVRRIPMHPQAVASHRLESEEGDDLVLALAERSMTICNDSHGLRKSSQNFRIPS